MSIFPTSFLPTLRSTSPLLPLFGLAAALFSCGHLGLEEYQASELGLAGADGSDAPVSVSPSAGGRTAIGSGGAGSGGANASGGTTGSGGGSDGSGGDGSGGNTGNGVYHDFEGELPTTTLPPQSGSAELTSERSHSGDQSIVFEQGSATQNRSDAHVKVPIGPYSSGELYFRAWVYVPGGTVTGMVKLAALDEGAGEGLDLNLRSASAVEVYSQIDDATWETNTPTYPEGDWFCVEFGQKLSSATDGWFRVWVDGSSVLYDDELRTLLPGGEVSTLSYGIVWLKETQSDTRFFMDDVAVDTARVGCN